MHRKRKPWLAEELLAASLVLTCALWSQIPHVCSQPLSHQKTHSSSSSSLSHNALPAPRRHDAQHSRAQPPPVGRHARVLFGPRLQDERRARADALHAADRGRPLPHRAAQRALELGRRGRRLPDRQRHRHGPGHLCKYCTDPLSAGVMRLCELTHTVWFSIMVL